jgi:hypothetical protein
MLRNRRVRTRPNSISRPVQVAREQKFVVVRIFSLANLATTEYQIRHFMEPEEVVNLKPSIGRTIYS